MKSLGLGLMMWMEFYSFEWEMGYYYWRTSIIWEDSHLLKTLLRPALL